MTEKEFEEIFNSMPEDEKLDLLKFIGSKMQMKPDAVSKQKQGDEEYNEYDEYDEDFFVHYLPAENVRKYTLRITLKGISPSIWRKIEVPSNASLRLLSELFVDLMGWANEHLNHFCKGNDYYAPAYQRKSELPPMTSAIRNFDQETCSIADLLSEKGQTIVWEYDFGDSWEHEIKLSSVDEYSEKEYRVIVFKGGKRSCPPEDCGGVWGYAELLELWAKRKEGKRIPKEDRERLEWYDMGLDFDPEYLDLDDCRKVVEFYNDEE